MERINEVTNGCFAALIKLRALDSATVPSAQLAYYSMCELIEQLRTNARQAGYQRREVDDITYAMVALADEIALHKGGPIRETWVQRPLQLHYFNENVAGDGFFQRLDAALGDPGRVDTLRVYYTCLLFGFRGRFSVRGGEPELDAVIHRVRAALASVLASQPLSVQPLAPKATVRTTTFPAIPAALLVLLFSLGLVVVLRLSLEQHTASILDRMQVLGDTQE